MTDFSTRITAFSAFLLILATIVGGVLVVTGATQFNTGFTNTGFTIAGFAILIATYGSLTVAVLSFLGAVALGKVSA